MVEQEQQEVRKGPWTEQEDFKLVSFVGLFGDRRWDFIAMVSGLKVAGDNIYRTGKSCRLRWVNYLHPGLKRGKMTPQEERLVLDLQSKWGNRWSRIARKLPGRTDNEIKNYWRTHMRKKAHDKKRRSEVPSSSEHFSTSSNNHAVDSHVSKEAGEESFYDTGGPDQSDDHMVGSTTTQVIIKVGKEKDHHEEISMDDIWKDIDHLSEENNSLQQHQLPVLYDGHSEEGCNFSCQPPTSTWEYSSWVMDEGSMLFPMSDPNYFSNNINVQYNNPAHF